MDFDFLHSPTSVLDFDESESSSSGESDTSTETETDSESEDGPTTDFEARSRDGAWYDVKEFVSYRDVESGDQEALVRLGWLEEWVNVRNDVRQRSIPCISPECTIIYPGDLVLCFKERILEDSLYYDAHVLDAQRHRHDVRGCHCNFLVQYDHDQSQEIVPLRKICRRPETDARLQQLRDEDAAAGASTSTSTSGSHQGSNVDSTSTSGSQQGSSNPLPPPSAGGLSGAAS